MKALVYKTYGQPKNVFQFRDIDTPVLEDNEVLVKVYNTTVNRTDEGIVTARYFISRFFSGLFKPKKQISGTDFSGIVEDVGSSVSFFKKGDRVFGFDDEGLSSHAEYLTIPERKGVSIIPNNLNFKEAVACLEGAHYAINFINKVHLQKNDRILINGATGAIGSALVQLSKAYGCYVVAVCDTNNIELVKSLGADEVIDYLQTDFTKNEGQYNFVLDAVGKSSFAKCKPLLLKKGIYTSSELGWMASNIFYALFTPLFGGKKVVFPIPKDVNTSIKIIKNLIDKDEFKPVIDRVYKFEDIVEAYSYVQNGQKTGNVVIDYLT